jgi:hypothetical protein
MQQITSRIESANQAIKASQCVQICSNILFGFYDLLDSVGVSIIIRILGNIKHACLIGHDFNELEEVCEMADKFYIEQRLVNSEEHFNITIEGFIQSINLVIADMQMPPNSLDRKENAEQFEKYLKLIDFVLQKMRFLI